MHWGLTIGSGITLWLGIDLAYASFVAWKYRRWERAQAWDEEGVRPECREYTIGSGTDALLCVHGFNDSPRVYDLMAPEFARRGYTVRALRLPGFGVRLREVDRVTRRDWLEAVRGELTSLRSIHTRVFAVGHSLGGALVARCLVERPELADGCGLLAPAIRVSRARSPLLAPETWHRLTGPLLWFTRTTYSPFPNDTDNPAHRRYPGGTKFSRRTSHAEMFALFRENRGLAVRLTVPTLMAVAQHDHVVDSEAAAAWFEEVAARPKKLVRLERSAHVLPLDFQWRELTEALDAFFRSLAATAPRGLDANDAP